MLEAFCRRPMRWGIPLGALALTGLRVAHYVAWELLYRAPQRNVRVPLNWSEMVVASLVRSLLPGAILGVFTAGLLAGWLNGSEEQVSRSARNAFWLALLLSGWAAWMIATFLNSWPATANRFGASVPGPDFLPWQARWTFLILAENFALQWAVALAIVGRITLNRLRAGATRAR